MFFIRHDRRCYGYIRLHHDYRRHIYHRHHDGQFRLVSPLILIVHRCHRQQRDYCLQGSLSFSENGNAGCYWKEKQ